MKRLLTILFAVAALTASAQRVERNDKQFRGDVEFRGNVILRNVNADNLLIDLSNLPLVDSAYGTLSVDSLGNLVIDTSAIVPTPPPSPSGDGPLLVMLFGQSNADGRVDTSDLLATEQDADPFSKCGSLQSTTSKG